jgi:hypothetical protein
MDGWLSPYPKVNVERHPCVHEAGMPTGGRQAFSTLLYQAVRLQGHFDMIEKFEDMLPRLHVFFKKQLSGDRF